MEFMVCLDAGAASASAAAAAAAAAAVAANDQSDDPSPLGLPKSAFSPLAAVASR